MKRLNFVRSATSLNFPQSNKECIISSPYLSNNLFLGAEMANRLFSTLLGVVLLGGVVACSGSDSASVSGTASFLNGATSDATRSGARARESARLTDGNWLVT